MIEILFSNTIALTRTTMHTIKILCSSRCFYIPFMGTGKAVRNSLVSNTLFPPSFFQTLLCFSRDTAVLEKFRGSCSNPARATIRGKTASTIENTVIYPPNGELSPVKQNVSKTALKARFYGHRFSGKPRFSGQNCYDGTTVFNVH